MLYQISLVLRHLPRVGISSLNQMLSSGKNFVLALYLVRVLDPVDFGLYGIGMAFVLLYAGIGNALLLTQMVVRMPEERDTNRPSYCANMLALCFAFMILTLLVALIAIPLVQLWMPAVLTADFIFSIAFAGVGTLATNYFVRLAYSNFEEFNALLVHTVSFIVLLASLWIVEVYANLATATDVLWLYAIANFSGAIMGLIKSSLPLRNIGLAAMQSAFKQSLYGGRWAVGGVGVTWLQSQSYIYIASIFHGAAGIAILNAARILISPFTFILPAFTQLLLPRLAQMRVDDPRKLVRMGVLYGLGLVTCGSIYVGVIAVIGQWMIPMIVGAKYEAGTLYWISLAWGIVLLFQLCRTAASLVLQATLRFKDLTVANSFTALATVLASLALTASFGLIGTLAAVGGGEAILAGLLWRHIKRRNVT